MKTQFVADTFSTHMPDGLHLFNIRIMFFSLKLYLAYPCFSVVCRISFLPFICSIFTAAPKFLYKSKYMYVDVNIK